MGNLKEGLELQGRGAGAGAWVLADWDHLSCSKQQPNANMCGVSIHLLPVSHSMDRAHAPSASLPFRALACTALRESMAQTWTGIAPSTHVSDFQSCDFADLLEGIISQADSTSHRLTWPDAYCRHYNACIQ